MQTSRRRCCACLALRAVVSLFILGGLVPAAEAAPLSTICEETRGDAGSLPNGAKRALAIPVLNRIDGILEGDTAADLKPDFEDMYLIRITDPMDFAAFTIATDPECGPPLNDSQLFLFDVCGRAVVANDNAPPGNPLGVNAPFSLLLPVASNGTPLVIQPGLYFLAISGSDNDPFSGAGAMFANTPNLIVGPLPPGGLQPIIGWQGKGEVGRYSIELTGVAGIIPTSCLGDLDQDGVVDGADLGFLLSTWGSCALNPCAPCDQDLDGSGGVDGADLGVLLSGWSCLPEAFFVCGNPASGDCFVVHGNPACEDPCCCTLVCNMLPFCCEVEWDTGCVDMAEAVCPEAPNSNDECSEPTPIEDGETPFSTFSATTGPPALPPECDRGFGLPLVQDIWFRWVPSQSGAVSIGTCGTADFDTRLAVYTGPCAGLVLEACNDDAPGCDLTSEIILVVSAGTPYRIRVGGFAGSGSGILTIKYLELACGQCPPGGIAEGEACGADLNGGCNGGSGSSTCCSPQRFPGCDDVICQDTVCALDPFCCESVWDALCADQAATVCPELCSTLFTPIECGQTICGSAWADGGTRDTDWYELVLTSPATITMSIESQLPMVIGVVNTGGIPDCGLATALDPFLLVPPCSPDNSFTVVLPAGVHWLFAATSTFDGHPCIGAENEYVVEVGCE